MRKERSANRGKREAIKAPAGRFTGVLHVLIRRAGDNEDKSLFSLLWSIEQKIEKQVLRDVRLGIEKLEALKLIRQRRPAVSKLSRYVE
jgi:hypothetical protein